MLTILIGPDWIRNRDSVLNTLVDDVRNEHPNRVLIVPELISHDTERRLSAAAGDSASRFAEVLSFSRLLRRVSDYACIGVQECLDNGGRVVAMAAAVRQLHSRLKAYASVESKPEFLEGLVNAIDEFKRCCIAGNDLLQASKQINGALAQKLEELSLIMESYDGLCENGKRDPSDQMTWLLDLLEECNYAQDHVFYFEGFPDYSRQHMQILKHIILNSPQVTISLNCDQLETNNPAFEKSSVTVASIIRYAKENNIRYELRYVAPRNDDVPAVFEKLFCGDITQMPSIQNKLVVQQFRTVYDECLAAAEVINTLIRKGSRFRDINIVCSDMQVYSNTLGMVFERCEIPQYQTGVEPILDKSVISTVLAALDASLNGFARSDVMRYLKSILSPLDLTTCDKIENYCVMWGIDGSRWLKPWEYHPKGLDAEWTDVSHNELRLLNEAREIAIAPLARLRSAFQKAINVKQQVTALYSFFEEIQLAERLSALSNQFSQEQDYRNVQILDQLWEILLSALEQVHDVLGETSWDAEVFTRLFRLLIGQYDVGTIPSVLDAVSVGSINVMRCQQAKHVIFLGVLEGKLPGFSGKNGVLTDRERDELRKLGIPLLTGSLECVQTEFYEIYGSFCAATDSVYVFCPSGQPSYLYKRLLTISGKAGTISTDFIAAKSNYVEAGAYLVRAKAEEIAEQLEISDTYLQICKKVNHELGEVSKENIEKIYGKKLYLSASQVDKQADCRLSYFLRYGIGAKERKAITVDPAEFGTYVHAVLEETARSVMEKGGFHEVSLDETLSIADKCSKQYFSDRFQQIDSKRLAYLFARNSAELRCIVKEQWEELHLSEFQPVGFEVAFGNEEMLSAIPIDANRMPASLRGYVDRVDQWTTTDKNYFRVVDYKTGRKDFDYCDIFNGYGLQMLLYMFALEEDGEKLLGAGSKPAGVQYFPARVPLVTSDGQLNDEQAALAHEKQLKRKGLILADDAVLYAMEPEETPKRLNYTRRKDGTIKGDLITLEQLTLLKDYVFLLLGRLVDDIASGCVEANPYTRGSSHNACTFCPYGSICNPSEIDGRRNYKTMSAQRFWEEVEKELKKHGR